MRIGDKVVYVDRYSPGLYIQRDKIYTVKTIFTDDAIKYIRLWEIVNPHAYFPGSFFVLKEWDINT